MPMMWTNGYSFSWPDGLGVTINTLPLLDVIVVLAVVMIYIWCMTHDKLMMHCR